MPYLPHDATPRGQAIVGLLVRRGAYQVGFLVQDRKLASGRGVTAGGPRVRTSQVSWLEARRSNAFQGFGTVSGTV